MHLLVPTVFCCWIIIFPYKSYAVGDQREPHLENFTSCVKEYSQDTSPLEEENKMYFKSGEIENVKCDGFGKSWGFEHNNFDSRFMIYPHSIRECRSNGLWSSPIPICIFRHTNSKFNSALQKAKVEPYQVRGGPLNTPYQFKDEWQPIGQKRCSSSKEQSNMHIRNGVIKSYDFVYSFHRPLFFSFTILYNADVIDMQLFAEKHGILRNISREGQIFLEDHYQKWRMLHSNESLDKQCSTINMPVYTDKLRVHYSIRLSKIEHDQTPLMASKHIAYDHANISFYRIVKCYESEEDDHRQTCPEPPKILNTEVHSRSSNRIIFSCNNGFILVDPIKNSNVSGVISCIEGDWFPYPFPICKRIIQSDLLPPRSFSTLINRNSSESSPHEKEEITKAPTTPTILQKVSAQSHVIFTLAILCLLVLGFVSSTTSTSMILYIKWRRQISIMREETVEERFIPPTNFQNETSMNCDTQQGNDVQSWQHESGRSEYSFETANDYDYPSFE